MYEKMKTYTFKEAIEKCRQREQEIKNEEKKEHDQLMSAICRLLDLGNRYNKND